MIGELGNGMRRYGYRELGLLMLSAGFLVGVLTDLVVTYGGGWFSGSGWRSRHRSAAASALAE